MEAARHSRVVDNPATSRRARARGVDIPATSPLATRPPPPHIPARFNRAPRRAHGVDNAALAPRPEDGPGRRPSRHLAPSYIQLDRCLDM